MNAISIHTAEHYQWGDLSDGWHLLKQEGVSIIQERVSPGGKEQWHLHERARQFFFVLEGEATMAFDHKTIILSKHQGIEVPPGIAHQFRNDSSADVSFLVISVPPSHGDRKNIAI